MENQLLNCLFANLMGLGKQLFPQGQAEVSGGGPSAFFDILSLKMGGMVNMLSSPVSEGIAVDDGKAAGGEGGDCPSCPVAASLDSEEISILVSSLLSAMDQPIPADCTSDMTEADRSAVTDFLRGVLEVLSGGDEIELTGAEGAEEETIESAHEGEDQGTEAAKNFLVCLASVLSQVGELKAKGGDTDVLPAGKDANWAEKVQSPDPSTMKMEVPQAVAQTVVPEDQETSAFVVEVVKAAKKAPVADPSMKNEIQTQAAAPAAEAPADTEDDLKVLGARTEARFEDGAGPEKIIIRVRETKDTEVATDSEGRDSGLVPQKDPSVQVARDPSSETKTARNSFGSMMVDKIEKLTEHFAGRNMNMDMTVKLKIGDNETVLVGLRDEGSSVTVEVKASSESTMNFLQSQKEDITKTLENKNIQTTIHVNIDQDAQGKRQQRQHREAGERETADEQDFGSFFEALA